MYSGFAYDWNEIKALKIIRNICNRGSDQVRFMFLNTKELYDLVFQVSKNGKVLSLFCDSINILPEKFHPYIKKRCELTRLYLKYLKIISNKLNDNKLEYYLFKTVKPFPYDMTDIDILFVDKTEMLKASEIIIKKLGFKVISKGTYSLTLRKKLNNFDIDVDLQPGIFAGTFNYILLPEMKNILGKIGYIKENLSLLIPELELVILAGHAIFKDFTISLANILYADYLLRICEDSILSTILRYNLHLNKPVETIRDITNIFKAIVMESSSEYSISQLNRFLVQNMITQFKLGKGNFTIPFIISIESYMKAFKVFLMKNDSKRILEMAKLPKSRGIKILLKRFKLSSQEETIKV